MSGRSRLRARTCATMGPRSRLSRTGGTTCVGVDGRRAAIACTILASVPRTAVSMSARKAPIRLPRRGLGAAKRCRVGVDEQPRHRVSARARSPFARTARPAAPSRALASSGRGKPDAPPDLASHFPSPSRSSPTTASASAASSCSTISPPSASIPSAPSRVVTTGTPLASASSTFTFMPLPRSRGKTRTERPRRNSGADSTSPSTCTPCAAARPGTASSARPATSSRASGTRSRTRGQTPRTSRPIASAVGRQAPVPMIPATGGPSSVACA